MQRAILLTAALALTASAMAADLKPGKYRIAGKLEGIPESEQSKPEDKCVTQKDIDSGLTKLGVEADNKSCKVSDFKRTGGALTYRTTCSEGGATYTTDVNATFDSDRFDMKMTIRAGKETNHLLVSGKRLGNC